MPVTVEFRALHRAIDDIRTAVTSLRATHGDIPALARLQNDLERLVLDVADTDALTAVPPTATSTAGAAQTGGAAPSSDQLDPRPGGAPGDEQYDLTAWAEDMDDEGVGGFHGHRPAVHRPNPGRPNPGRPR